jgi:sugar O-acyltransferase (sialic acid O-acetyltransferase NeuD family)
MDKKRLFIYGVGKLAEYAAYVFQNDSEYDVEGYCIEREYIQKNKQQIPDTKIFEEIEGLLLQEDYYLFIAVGNNLVRERIYTAAKEKGINLATYLSSRASTWPNIKTGDNCFIGEGSVIQPFVTIGANCILFGARLGHHSKIGDHVLLSGPTIGGNVTVGKYTFIGLNAVVLQNLEIGAKNIIGMGVSIKNSTGEGEVYSSPTFKKREVNFDDISNSYLN